MVINLDMTLTSQKPFTTGVMWATALLGVRTEPVQNPEDGVAPDLPVLVGTLMYLVSTLPKQPRTWSGIRHSCAR